MRKNSPRKWLHACLDLLPVILIPVFMIYSHRHTIDSGSIQVQEKLAIDFNQLKVNGNFEDLDTYLPNGSSLISVENNIISMTPNGASYPGFLNNQDLITDHKYLISFDYKGDSSVSINFNGNGYVMGSATSDFTLTQRIIKISQISHHSLIVYTSANHSFEIRNYEIFDLTQMNLEDITIQEFNQLFPSAYYPYVVSDKQLIDGDLITYNDTDILSQFTYQLYNSVDKYFNMGNVFNLNGVYDWFNLNIFNGQAPIYIFIVWQIVLYEFVMDLLFLLYGLFMWFIDMIQKLMEKPLDSVK